MEELEAVISAISSGASETSSTTEHLRKAAAELAQHADRLRGKSDEFIGDVRRMSNADQEVELF